MMGSNTTGCSAHTSGGLESDLWVPVDGCGDEDGYD